MTVAGPDPPRRPADRVAETAATVADEVWADALAEARRRAGDRLADLLADAIVRSVLERRPPASRPGVSAPQAREPDLSEALYVYAVTRSGVPAPAAVGLDGQAEVQTVGQRDVALVVSRVAPDLLHGLEQEPVSEEGRLATLVRRHDAVVTAAFGQAPVLPLRFGTLLRDEEAAQRLVDSRYELLDEQLDHLAGRAEYGVRVVEQDDPDSAAATPSGKPPVENPLSEHDDHHGEDRGTAYLTRRRDELAARDEQAGRRADVLAVTREHLDAYAVESVTGRGVQDGVLLDVAYLVASERRGDFLAAVERESERLASSGLRVEVQGPWPPYSFARVELGPETARA